MRILKIFSISCLLAFTLTTAWAADTWIVKRVEVTGLKRIQRPTVMNYLPVHTGQRFSSKLGNRIIRRLYQTHFFSDVQLSRKGSTLVVQVVERPTIGRIRINGNSAIPSDRLKQVLKENHVALGQVYISSTLKLITESLHDVYRNLGYREATISLKVLKQPRNRVSLRIKIKEGPIAKVKQIRIVGNHVFSQSKLLDQFQLTTSGLFTFFTKSDHYSKQKLEADLMRLRDFYYNHGYLGFSVLSQKVHANENSSDIYITITVHEGKPYRISGLRFVRMNVANPEKVKQMVTLKVGSVFSREAVIAINEKIQNHLANQGYAYPQVNATPKLNEKMHTVLLQYRIETGKRYYVRRISVSGNTKSKSAVVRRELVQLEGSRYSHHDIEESKRRIRNLPYFSDVSVSPKSVAGKSHQLDLDVAVKEVSAGRASINGGYADTDGFLYGLTINEPNFAGTGNEVSLSFQRSSYSSEYNFGYVNPYYTVNGLSRGFNLYYTKVTPSKVNLTSYSTNGYGGSVAYSMPISEYNRINYGFGYQRLRIVTDNTNTASSILSFLNQHGRKFDEVTLSGGWSFSDYDRFPFVRKGFHQSVGLEVGTPVFRRSLRYFKVNYSANGYYPIWKDYIFNAHTTLGYGNGYGSEHNLPFFKNYYAGGVKTVPGYEGNSLGPRDEFGNAMGGNIELVGGVQLILPQFLSPKLRIALTFNAGNVFNKRVELDQLRYSAGALFTWDSPFGILGLSVAAPLNKKPGDHQEVVQLDLGVSV